MHLDFSRVVVFRSRFTTIIIHTSPTIWVYENAVCPRRAAHVLYYVYVYGVRDLIMHVFVFIVFKNCFNILRRMHTRF